MKCKTRHKLHNHPEPMRSGVGSKPSDNTTKTDSTQTNNLINSIKLGNYIAHSVFLSFYYLIKTNTGV